MRKKQSLLLQSLLKQHTWTTAAILAKELDISVRTVKSYVAELNLNYPKIILSSNLGYKIDPNKATLVLKMKDGIPQDYDDRCIFLIKRCLLNKNASLNIFDLCSELFISYSTLKNDISKMNTTFSAFNLVFACSNNHFQIKGKELDKRRLITHVMSEEVSDNFLDFSFLQNSFPEFRIDQISEKIKQILQNQHIYINDFSFINLIMHLLIIIIRAKNGNHPTSVATTKLINNNLIDTEKEICAYLNSFFKLKCTQEDELEIQLLLQSGKNIDKKLAKNDPKAVIPTSVLKITNQLIESVKNHFYIDLASNDFITPFALHLKNLQNRLNAKSIIKNPMWESLKLSCPTIYDIAAFMAYQLGIIFKHSISEDEIGFLALHIGTEIERQKQDQEKVTCTILCPSYLEMREKLVNKIIEEFENRINIKKIASFENEIPLSGIDLLITTIPVSPNKDRVDVMLAPFTSNFDIAKIEAAIQKIEDKKKQNFLNNNLDLYFNEHLFLYLNEKSNKRNVINFLGNKLISLSYVDSDFINEIWKREEASSTAFMKVAIPHPMKMNAIKTSIAIAVSSEGIEWGAGQVVNVVCMIAFNKMDNKNFHKLYEILIDLFNKPTFLKKVKQCTTFEELKTLLFSSY